MAKVFLLHWDEAEIKERAAILSDAGHEVMVHWSVEGGPPLREELPEVAVISLDRLPSHGRAVAEWLWEAKKRQHIPILFVGGDPAKVDAARAKFPKAFYCPTASMLEKVADLVKARPAPSESARKP